MWAGLSCFEQQIDNNDPDKTIWRVKCIVDLDEAGEMECYKQFDYTGWDREKQAKLRNDFKEHVLKRHKNDKRARVLCLSHTFLYLFLLF
jgi:hypothetical protein